MAITYRDAGVDIDAGEQLVERIKPLARATRTPHVVSDVGGFAGLCALPGDIEDPLLVSGTDGVGTKLRVAFATGKHDTIGIDLVAMCVNDIATIGARPLFFLDYFACGKLDVDTGEAVVRGIAEGCKLAGCALLGGETAEMPGMYPEGEYELAGFAVGAVGRAKVLGPERVRTGDELVAVASSGLHSNGYSLARRVLIASDADWNAHPPELDCTIGEAMLEPTRIYAKSVLALADDLGDRLHATSHITGGGVTDNLPRVLPDGCAAVVRMQHERPAIFRLIERAGPVDEDEMRRTFNLGIGLVAVVAAGAGQRAVDVLRASGEQAWICGEVRASSEGARVEYADRL